MSTKVVDLAERRRAKQEAQVPRCDLCGRPGGYGASLLVCGPCRAVEALCGHDLGLTAEVVSRLGPDLAAELVTAAGGGAGRRVAAP